MKDVKFKSTHHLKFKTGPHIVEGAPSGLEKFKIGSVHGLWREGETVIEIWAIINDEPGNGHMDDAIEWFVEIARLSSVILRVVEISSVTFRNQLIDKWGFATTDVQSQLIKYDFLNEKQPVKTSAKW